LFKLRDLNIFNKCHGFRSMFRGIVVETAGENSKSYDTKPCVASMQQTSYACAINSHKFIFRLPERT
jgi:hypothetical protein